MNFRVLYLVFLSLSFAAPARAATTVTFTYCNDAFKKLMEAKAVETPPPVPTPPAPPPYPEPNVWVMPGDMTKAQKEAYSRLQTLEKVPVAKIFPDTRQVYDAVRVKTPDAAMSAYRKQFDEIWQARVDSGIMPKFELNRYRDWLRTQNAGSRSPYPAIDAGELYNKFVKHDRPIAEYFNEKFLEFIEKDSGRNDFENVNAYFQQMEKNWLKYKKNATIKGTKNLARNIWFNATVVPGTIVAGSVLAYQTELTNKITGAIVGTVKDPLNNTITSGTTTLTDTLGSLYVGFRSREDLDTAFNTINVATEELAKTRLSVDEKNPNLRPLDRSTAVPALYAIRKKYDAIMPDFKEFIDANKKDFDKEKAAPLLSMSIHASNWANYYEQARRELMIVKNEIAKEDARVQAALANPNSTPEERVNRRNIFEDNERMATIRRKLDRNEDFLAKYLAKYLVYSSHRGSKNPVGEEISGQYETLLESYLDSNSLGKLQKAWLTEINEHTAMIKSFMPKSDSSTKIKTEVALEEKKAAEEAKSKAEQTKAKADATATAAAKKSQTEGPEAAKDLAEQAEKLKAEAAKAEAEARAKAEAAAKAEEKAQQDPTGKTEKAPEAPANPAAKPGAKP